MRLNLMVKDDPPDTGYNIEAITKRNDLEWETRKVHKTQLKYHLRVIADKRLIDSLSDSQLNAMAKIRTAYLMRTNGIGYASLDLLRTPGSASAGDANDYGATLQADYLLWVGRMILARLSHPMAMGTIADGNTIEALARHYRIHKMTVKKNLLDSLDLWS